MSDETSDFTTYSTLGEEPFEAKVDKATDYYRRMIYSEEHYYGLVMDVVLHDAVYKSLVATGSVSIESLCEQLGRSAPSEFEKPVAKRPRDLIENNTTLSADVITGDRG